MPDFAAYLPLSNRPRRDESSVGVDRRDDLAALVDEGLRLVAAASPARRSALSASFLVTAGLADLPVTGSEQPLAAAAAAVRAGGKRSVRALGRGAEAVLRLARSVDVEPVIAPSVSGAVALAYSGIAAFDRRAVIKGHTVRATDAGWEFGDGPVLAAPALVILAFLLAVADDPPRPPAHAPGSPTLGR